MTDRATRGLAAICGITGVMMLTAHFLSPATSRPTAPASRRLRRSCAGTGM